MWVCVCVYTHVREQHYSVLLCIFSSQRPGLQAWWCTTHPNTYTLDSEMIHFSWTQGSNFILWLLFLLSPWTLCLSDVSLPFSRAQASQTHHPPASPLRSLPLQQLSFIHKCGAISDPLAKPGQAHHSKMLNKAGHFHSDHEISVWAATVSNQWLPACGDHINVLQGFLP